MALAQFSQLVFALFVGPFVGGLLLAKMFDLDDDLPAVLRITRLRPASAAVGATAIFAVFLAVLSYEVVVRGPEFDERGEVGWIAPDVLGFNAQPVQVTAVDDESVTEMLYLGGNAAAQYDRSPVALRSPGSLSGLLFSVDLGTEKHS